MNCTGLGAVNGAVESLVRSMALELGPDIRVNCMSPGMVRSDAYAEMEEDAQEAMYEATGESLPEVELALPRKSRKRRFIS
ncbi:SDR family oxidoreductase [Gammaproteobacteria bacterium]|nr:SDR family oxidoreductase [Gammaproteobacteria bacterium]